MGDSEKRGKELQEEAEKKIKGPKGFLSSLSSKFFGDSSRLDDAAELFVKAGNAYKMAKNWPASGHCFAEAAKLFYQQDSKHNAATHYIDAANAYKKSNPRAGIDILMKAVDIYTDMGRFVMAAKQHQNVAEIYEKDLADIDSAIQHYEHAADYFRGEENISSANKCMVKVAHFSAQQEKYTKAIKIYEEVGTAASENSLIKYSAKDHFFKAALCHLCIDPMNCENSLQKYEQIYPAFADCREYKLLKQLLEALDEQQVDSFTKAVQTFDSISRIDQWTTTMLIRVKKTLSDEPDLR